MIERGWHGSLETRVHSAVDIRDRELAAGYGATMAEQVIFRDDVTVELIKSSASDADVIWQLEFQLLENNQWMRLVKIHTGQQDLSIT